MTSEVWVWRGRRHARAVPALARLRHWCRASTPRSGASTRWPLAQTASSPRDFCNLLSECATFGLNQARAEAIAREVEATVQAGWKRALLDEGLSDDQAQDWATCFRPVPDVL